jgi:uncharacterized protein YecA (UPF0149 family)
MGLFEQWKEAAAKERSQAEHDNFWNAYLEKEKKIYEYLLEDHQSITEGVLSELAERFGMEPATFVGFLDGINTSLVKEIELDDLKEDSPVKLEIDFEKLYWNMLEAKAEWLYTLEQWDDILSREKRSEITKKFRQSKMAVSNKVGRNDPCPCGSGKKYKKCCGK